MCSTSMHWSKKMAGHQRRGYSLKWRIGWSISCSVIKYLPVSTWKPLVQSTNMPLPIALWNISSFLNLVITTKRTVNGQHQGHSFSISFMLRNLFNHHDQRMTQKESLNSCSVMWFRISRFSAQMGIFFQLLQILWNASSI